MRDPRSSVIIMCGARAASISFVTTHRFLHNFDHDDSFVILSAAECLLIYVHALMLCLSGCGSTKSAAHDPNAQHGEPAGFTHIVLGCTGALSCVRLRLCNMTPRWKIIASTLNAAEAIASLHDLVSSQPYFDRIDPGAMPARSFPSGLPNISAPA